VRRTASFFFLATVFCCTFEKVHWNLAGTVSLADVLAILFVVAFLAVTVRPRVPRTTAVLLAFFAAFLLVYLAGFFNLETSDAPSRACRCTGRTRSPATRTTSGSCSSCRCWCWRRCTCGSSRATGCGAC
jgi:hypothetical protein